MGSGQVKAGPSVTPTTDTAGTDGNKALPRKVSFVQPVRPCHLINESGGLVWVKVNTPGETCEVGNHFLVADDTWVDLSDDGRIPITHVNFATAGAGDLDTVTVEGWV